MSTKDTEDTSSEAPPGESPRQIDSPPPDGGLWAWLQVVVMFFGTWNSWGVVNTFGVYQEYYQSNLLKDESAGAISWIGTLAGFCIYAGALVVGPLYDLGYIRTLVLISALLQCFAFMMLSLCTKYYQIILCQGIASGIASSLAFICGISTVGTWFEKRRPLAVGFGATGSAFGGVIYSVLTRQLLKRVGFAWSSRILGFIMLGTQLIAFLCSRPRLAPRKSGGFFDWHAFAEFDMSTLSWALLLSNAGAYIFYFYAQSYAINEVEGADYNIMIYTTAILNAGSVPGRIIPNIMAQRYGPVTMFAVSILATAILCWFWLMANTTAGILTIACLVGFTTGPVVSLPSPACASITADLSRLGTRFAFLYSFAAAGLLIGPPLAGILIRDHAWKYGIIYSASLLSLGFVVSVMCRQYLLKGKLRGSV